MGLFSRKQEVKLDDFCRNFYENQVLNPTIGGINAGEILLKSARDQVSQYYPEFTNIDLKKLSTELIILRFELFALAWTHKFVNGKRVLLQSDFTRQYLQKKGEDDIWTGMEEYNNAIDGATLHWLQSLNRANLGFNYNMRKDLSVQNINEAKKLGIDSEESIKRANQRLWSENAWKQNIVLQVLVFTLCQRLKIDPEKLNKEAVQCLAAIIYGFYQGAKQSWEQVKIVD